MQQRLGFEKIPTATMMLSPFQGSYQEPLDPTTAVLVQLGDCPQSCFRSIRARSYILFIQHFHRSYKERRCMRFMPVSASIHNGAAPAEAAAAASSVHVQDP